LCGQAWSQSDKNLLLVLSAKCRFCDESVPFYQRLVKEAGHNSKARLIAAFPDAENENRRYLREKMIDIPEVRQVSPASIGLRGTPALLLIDKGGTIVEEWMGKLPTNVEDAIILRVGR
jgi:hypothetical protein